MTADEQSTQSEAAAPSSAPSRQPNAPRFVSEQEFRRVTMLWVQIIGWVLIIFAIAAIGGGWWLGVQVHHVRKALNITQDQTYDECMADPSKTAGECTGLSGDPAN